jgi:N-formylglutamate amidohydrolase
MNTFINPPLDVWIEGNTPLLIDVPHAGTYVPPPIREVLTAEAQNIPDADWHVHLLYEFAAELGASLMIATHARYVVDLNRDPESRPLYPGADNTELVPTFSFDHAALYRESCNPDVASISDRRERYWKPYHSTLEKRIEAIRARHGYAIVLDAHSIRSEVPRFFEGRLPDLNLGTADGSSCAESLEAAAWKILSSAQPFTAVRNGRFKGGYITRHYGSPDQSIHTLQLEIAQCCYMDEGPPYVWNARKAEPLQRVLKELAEVLLRWVP